MRLAPEEYRRGILFWSISAKATFKTSTAPAPAQPPEWSVPLTDSNGSKVQSPPQRYIRLACDLDDPSATERPFLVRWEREFNGAILTALWDGSLVHPGAKLMHIPNYGKFHRLVLATPYLGWAEDAVIRVADVAIRLIQGRVKGEKVEPLDEVEVGEGQVSITGRATGLAEAEGRFVEIVAPGESAETAEQLAYSIVGLLALCMGDHVVGEVVFSESYDASQSGQLGSLRIPVTARIPRQTETVELDTVDLILPFLLGDDRSARARTLALRWYEQAIRATSPLDELLSYFIGIETVVNAYAADHGPVAEAIDRRTRFDALLQRLSEEFDDETVGLVTQRLVQPTLMERFKLYVLRHGWEQFLVEHFRRLAGIRNDAFHGNPVHVDEEQTTQARDILIRLLKCELGLVGEMQWEKVPHISALTLEYELLLDQGDGLETT